MFYSAQQLHSQFRIVCLGLICAVVALATPASAKTVAELSDRCPKFAYGEGATADSTVELDETEIYAGPIAPEASPVCIVRIMGGDFAEITKVDLLPNKDIKILVEYGLTGSANLYLGDVAEPTADRLNTMPLVSCDGKDKDWCYANIGMTGLLTLSAQIVDGEPQIRALSSAPDARVKSEKVRQLRDKIDFDRGVFFAVNVGTDNQRLVKFTPLSDTSIGLTHFAEREETRALMAWINQAPNDAPLAFGYALKGENQPYTGLSFNAGEIKFTLQALVLMMKWPKPK